MRKMEEEQCLLCLQAYAKPCKLSHQLAAPGVHVILHHHRFDVNVVGQMAYGVFCGETKKLENMLWFERMSPKMGQSTKTGSNKISLFLQSV